MKYIDFRNMILACRSYKYFNVKDLFDAIKDYRDVLFIGHSTNIAEKCLLMSVRSDNFAGNVAIVMNKKDLFNVVILNKSYEKISIFRDSDELEVYKILYNISNSQRYSFIEKENLFNQLY